MRGSRWAGAAVASTTVGYVVVLMVVTPSEQTSVALLAFIPLVLAAGLFGLRAGLAVAVGLVAVTMAIIEVSGPGMDAVLATYRGIPLLAFVVTAIVVGRFRDLSTAMEEELERRRQVEIELRQTQRRLEEMIQSKDELIASVGHELRTPLTAVLGFAEMLKLGNEGEMTRADRVEMVDFIAREAFDLSGIIDDLLVAARMEIGKLEASAVPTALRAQLSQVLETWDPGTVSRVTVMGGDPKAIADPARVRQILRNLITNALRYGGSAIEVEFGAEARTVFIEVRDDGPALPEAEWERIFDAYYRYHAEPSQPGSVGLGLTVARGLARLMGGDLSYRRRGEMSVFALTLPAAR
jgi:signal transduction histidine kinase